MIYISWNATQDVRLGGSMTVVPITSSDLMAAEVSWFSALCSDDYQFLGIPDGNLRSSWEHCSSIVKEAENYGLHHCGHPES